MVSARRDALAMQAWAALKGATWAVLGRMKASGPEGGATIGHMGFLHALAQAKEPLTPTELAGCVGVTPATVTGALTAMEELGLVERTRSAEDRRAVKVVVTPRGREVQARWAETVHAHVREALAPLSDAQLAMLSETLPLVGPPIVGPPRDVLVDIRHDAPAAPKRAPRKRRK